ncbi:MAG TPA: trypsin-like peptidase domain-containing protein [Candidatus Sulfotelmatobacter sp.]|nr:trypsin-like peptidase domain-containing protein [Candidatus Sulfotelmatobacter sp.]
MERDGRFVIEDPRTQFHAGQDHKVIVYFEWEGALGPHKFEALWKNPSGKVVVVSDFQFEPHKSPFSGYWSMLLDDDPAIGFWTLEARIDGEAAGNYSFEVTSNPSTTPVAHVRIPPSEREIYRQAEAATVYVEKLDASGKPLGRASGFFLAPNRVITTFGSIDGASGLRIILAGGKSLTTNQITSWNRWQDWAVLSVDSTEVSALKPAPDKSANVGEHCYSLGISPAGIRTILEASITGDSDQAPAGRRLSLSVSFDSLAVGGPVLTEFGEVIALLGGSLLPGAAIATPTSAGASPPMAGSAGTVPAAFAVPIDLVKLPDSNVASSTLADLASMGQFIPPLEGPDRVGFGALALGLDKQKGIAWPRQTRDLFSHSDGQIVLFISWQPKPKLKGVAIARFYDLNNRQVGELKPANVNLNPNSLNTTYWPFSVAAFPPGIYRADVFFGDAPVWREFFRVVP